MPSARSSRALLALLLAVLGAGEGAALIRGPRRLGHPVIADESVYLFEAKLLASGRLSRPSPPLPELFQATHLLVTPRFAGKYLPGHALWLAPFERFHAAWLAPALALGLLAALLFLAALAMELPPGAALFAGLLPLVSQPIATLFGTYLSWTSSLPIGAAALACLALARRTQSPRALGCASALAGLLFWIRPFTGLAMIGALAVISLQRARSSPSPRRWLLAAALPLAVWALLTLAVCKEVTGQFTQLPWTLYAREYMPFDGPGFGPTHAPPAPLTVAYQQPFFEQLRQARERYTFQRALAETPRRLAAIADLSPGSLLWPLALFGLVASAGALWPAILFGLCFFLLQFTFYSPTPFYLTELFLPLALGLTAAAAQLWRWIARLEKPAVQIAAIAVASLPAMILAVDVTSSLRSIRAEASSGSSLEAEVDAALAPALRARGIVFFDYAGFNGNEQHYTDPDLANAALIRALDRGAENAKLLAQFPGRPGFRFALATRTLTPLATSGSAPGSPR